MIINSYDKSHSNSRTIALRTLDLNVFADHSLFNIIMKSVVNLMARSKEEDLQRNNTF